MTRLPSFTAPDPKRQSRTLSCAQAGAGGPRRKAASWQGKGSSDTLTGQLCMQEACPTLSEEFLSAGLLPVTCEIPHTLHTASAQGSLVQVLS